jgi:hypothetical protein
MRRFRNLDSVRCWIESFVEWYNNEHRHSGIKYVTPNQRHLGEADAICAGRRRFRRPQPMLTAPTRCSVTDFESTLGKIPHQTRHFCRKIPGSAIGALGARCDQVAGPH